VREEQRFVAIFITDDGKEFADQGAAEAHEARVKRDRERLDNIMCWSVSWQPDLTEGRGNQSVSWLAIERPHGGADFATLGHWAAFILFGAPLAYVQGSAPVTATRLTTVTRESYVAAVAKGYHAIFVSDSAEAPIGFPDDASGPRASGLPIARLMDWRYLMAQRR
jgi:hypothetical protein